MSRKQIKFTVGVFFIIGAIGYLISTSISKTSMYFVTVSELVSQVNSYQGSGLKVKGKIVKGSIMRDPKNYLEVAFAIEDDAKSNLKVVYKGITPDMFADEREVVVEGNVKEGVFHANTLLTSCPSKYEAEKEAGKTHPGDELNLQKKYPASPVTLPKTAI